MADLYGSKYSSASYSQSLETNPEVLSKLISRQVKRTAGTVWLISMFLFLYFLLSISLSFEWSMKKLMDVSMKGLTEHVITGLVHILGILAGALGLYSTKALEINSIRRFVHILTIAGALYTAYLFFWSLQNLRNTTDRLEAGFDVTYEQALELFSIGWLCFVSVLVYFISCASDLCVSIEAWRLLNPRKDMSIRPLSLVLDR